MDLSSYEKALLLGALLRELRHDAMKLEIKASGYDMAQLRKAVTDLLTRVERIKYIVENSEGL